MEVIAKMKVASVEDYGMSKRIKFECVYDGNINSDSPENRSFTKATPWGECVMSIDNPHVWPAFRLQGGEDTNWRQPSHHYVVFIDAEKYSLDEVYAALATLNA